MISTISSTIRTRRVQIIVAALILVALLLPTAWIVRSVAASGTSLTISPTSGQAGITVQASGSGFGHKELIYVNFDTTLVAAAQSSASKSGTFSISFVVPQSAQPGNHTVTATGQSTGTTASATFQIPSPTPTPTSIPSPPPIPTPTAIPTPIPSPGPSPSPTPPPAMTDWLQFGFSAAGGRDNAAESTISAG